MLRIVDASVYYDGVRALETVSLDAAAGEILALIGANGAGKTTLLNLVSGIVKPATGRVLFDGGEITGLPPEKIVERGIVHVPEGRHLFAPLTVRENLELGAYSRRRREGRKQILKEMEYIFQLFPVLAKRLHQKAGTLSGGEQQMLAIGRGLMGKPRLLLLDEPSLGLAPLLVQEILTAIRRLNREGTTVLLVEQNARAALRISDRAYVLETGAIRLQGSAAELLQDEAVKKAYLGDDAWRQC